MSRPSRLHSRYYGCAANEAEFIFRTQDKFWSSIMNLQNALGGCAAHARRVSRPTETCLILIRFASLLWFYSVVPMLPQFPMITFFQVYDHTYYKSAVFDLYQYQRECVISFSRKIIVEFRFEGVLRISCPIMIAQAREQPRAKPPICMGWLSYGAWLRPSQQVPTCYRFFNSARICPKYRMSTLRVSDICLCFCRHFLPTNLASVSNRVRRSVFEMRRTKPPDWTDAEL